MTIINCFYSYLKFIFYLGTFIVIGISATFIFTLPVWISAYQVEIITVKKIDLQNKVNLHEKKLFNGKIPNEHRTTEIITICPIRELVGHDKRSNWNHCYWNRNVTFRYYKYDNNETKSEKSSETLFDASKSKIFNYYSIFVGEILKTLILTEDFMRSIPICIKSPLIIYPSVIDVFMTNNSTEKLTKDHMCLRDTLIIMDWAMSCMHKRYGE